jgi:hypothetical protein
MENTDEDSQGWESNFWTAYDALSEKKSELFLEGIKKAINQQQALIRQGTSLIENKTIVLSGPFRHAFLPNTNDLHYFTQPMALSRLGSFITEALMVNGGKAKKKPFVIGALNSAKNTFLLAGLTGYAATANYRKYVSRMIMI